MYFYGLKVSCSSLQQCKVERSVSADSWPWIPQSINSAFAKSVHSDFINLWEVWTKSVNFVTEKGSLESWYWENRFSACIFISMQLHDCVQLNLPPVFLASVTLLIVHSDCHWNWAAEQKLISIVLIFRFCSLRDNSLFLNLSKNKIYKQ